MASFKSVKGIRQPNKRESKTLATQVKNEKGRRYRSAVTGRYVTRSEPSPPSG